MPMPKARRSHIIEAEHVVIETARLVSVGDFEMDVARTGLRMDSLWGNGNRLQKSYDVNFSSTFPAERTSLGCKLLPVTKL